MTNREFYNSIVAGDFSSEVIDFAKDAILKLDARNAARKSKPTKAQLEVAARRTSILDFFRQHISESFERVALASDLGVTPSQLTAAIKAINDSGNARIIAQSAKSGKSKITMYQMVEGE